MEIGPALSTLAAAFAEKGDFAGAVQMRRKALEVTPEKEPIRGYYLACLDRYRPEAVASRRPARGMGLRKYRRGQGRARGTPRWRGPVPPAGIDHRP